VRYESSEENGIEWDGMEYPRMSEYVADVVDDGIASVEISACDKLGVSYIRE
jgi:hypothetical protein